MSGWLSVLLSVTILAALEGVLRRWWTIRWAQRGFTVDRISAVRPTVVRAGVAVIAAVAAALRFGPWQAGVAAALIVWLAAVAWFTDMADHRIPKEPCWTVLAVGTLLGVSGFTEAGAASAVTALVVTVMIVGILVLATRGGIGSGDARLLVAFTIGAWWFGYTPTLIGLMLASLVQVVFRFTVFRHRVGRGYPFAPALAIGYVAAVVVFSGPDTVCAEWVYMLGCQPV